MAQRPHRCAGCCRCGPPGRGSDVDRGGVAYAASAESTTTRIVDGTVLRNDFSTVRLAGRPSRFSRVSGAGGWWRPSTSRPRWCRSRRAATTQQAEHRHRSEQRRGGSGRSRSVRSGRCHQTSSSSRAQPIRPGGECTCGRTAPTSAPAPAGPDGERPSSTCTTRGGADALARQVDGPTSSPRLGTGTRVGGGGGRRARPDLRVIGVPKAAGAVSPGCRGARPSARRAGRAANRSAARRGSRPG